MGFYQFVCLSVLICLAHAKHEAYDGHTLFEVKVTSPHQAKLVNSLEELLPLDFWSSPAPGRPGQILVSKALRNQFEDVLSTTGVEFTVKVENIKELLDLEDRLLAEASRKSANRTRVGALPPTTTYSYAEVDQYLEDLAQAYPNVVTLVNAGVSFEGRPIKYLKISTTNFQDPSKPVVFIESLLHAREWITLPAALHAIEKLVINVSEQDLVEDIDWIILPIANPDGYEHSRDETRFWRKNRATGYMTGNICSGVDLNRNFDINWSVASSNIVCMDTFHGRSPFSEPESAIIRDIMLENSDRLELFLDIHSFGSMILYGYGTGQLPANALIVHLVGVQMATAIDAVKTSWNPNYVVGNVALVLYEASGSAGDFGQTLAPLSYTYELPGHRYGLGTAAGFLVDPDFIEQAGIETWEGIKAGARYARNSYRLRRNL